MPNVFPKTARFVPYVAHALISIASPFPSSSSVLLLLLLIGILRCLAPTRPGLEMTGSNSHLGSWDRHYDSIA